jgi:hypothetical protein
LEAAEIDKERYNKEVLELKNQQKSAPKPQEPEENAKAKENGNSSNGSPKIPSSNSSAIEPTRKVFNNEIPIFTEEFLEHNKTIETEVRLLRKQTIDLEQQISVLEKHIENLNNGIDKICGEIEITNGRNTALEEYLINLKTLLASVFESNNIESYMKSLSNGTAPAGTVNKAKDILKKLDLKIKP